MDPSVERGLAALERYNGVVTVREDNKVVIEFDTPEHAVTWRITYASVTATTKFVPSESDGVTLEVTWS